MSHLVIRRTPQRNTGTLENRLELEPEARRVFLAQVWIHVIGLGKRLRVEFFNLLFHRSKLGRIAPNDTPIFVTVSLRGTGTNGFEHKLGRVGVVRDGSTIAVEVVDEDVTVLADVSEVDAFTTTLKEQETVEGFEEERVRLVCGGVSGGSSRLDGGLTDRAQNGLTGGSELAQETAARGRQYKAQVAGLVTHVRLYAD